LASRSQFPALKVEPFGTVWNPFARDRRNSALWVPILNFYGGCWPYPARASLGGAARSAPPPAADAVP
jgi:hypothetical protein